MQLWGYYVYREQHPLNDVYFRVTKSRLARPHRGYPFGPGRRWVKESGLRQVISREGGPQRKAADQHYRRHREFPGDYRPGQVGFEFLGE